MKSIGEFFSDLTDLDNRILKTVITLFRSPSKVVAAYLSGQVIYTKPLRYALLTSSAYVIADFLYEFFFGVDDKIADWFIPVRVTEFLEKLDNFHESFFPFLMLLTLVPPAIVVMKLLFFKKTWQEVTVIMLYAFAQLWLLMTMFIVFPVGKLTEFLLPMISFTVVFVCFRKVMEGNFFVALGKWLFMSVLLIMWFYEIANHIVDFTFANVVVKDHSSGQLIKPDPVSPQVTLLDEPEGTWRRFAYDDPDNTVLVMNKQGERTRIKFSSPENKELGELQLAGEVRKVVRVRITPQCSGWLVLHDLQEKDGNRELLATVISPRGKTWYTKKYVENIVLNSGIVVNGKTLLLAGGKVKDGEIVPFIDAIEFSVSGDQFNVTGEKNYFLPNIRQRFNELYDLDSSAESIDLVATNYEISASGIGYTDATEAIQFSVMRINLDSTLKIVWENVIFHKTTKYSPHLNNFRIKTDPVNDRIIATYTLANNEVLASELFCLDTNGELIWKKELVENDYTFINDFYSDKTGVYFCGRIASAVPKHPVVSWYGLGLLGHVSADGNTVSNVRYGKFRNNSFQHFNKLIVSDSIKVFNYSSSKNLLGQTDHYEMLTFKNSFVFQ